MKKAMLMLFAMALLVGSAVAEFNGVADSPCQKECDKWKEGHSCGDNFKPDIHCVEICPGEKHKDKCGCNHFHGEKCDWCGKKEPCSQCDKREPCNGPAIDGNMDSFWMKHPENQGFNCMVLEKCKECGKTLCDGRCDECREKCCVYEYCSVCGIKRSVKQADGFCDKCGRDCYCIEKCEKCGHNHYFNGWCDNCASRCYYGRCCHEQDGMDRHDCQDNGASCMGNENCVKSETQVFTIFLGDENVENAEPMMPEGYPGMEGMNHPAEDEGQGQMQ
jgi:hypothetical protein